ncbi:type II secretion system protein GspG [Blastopirellula sp. JC732]|uniref:Type II secretion system protein GspG n=1 Tax=Blastopirellula sediminis TaxID=2894196 RepID=A0A9X1SFF6_9BACT|nr:type II secretion system protein GspG [Blastopirellula sediminis]MCC9607761.1 type II secretion system protein GspG [Blastopirellula sediminis]MCC9627446.1 type II secretion system protein GspG [Blastopirellula sediminis]
MIDDWGRPLHWQSDGESVVRVWSLGRDDKIGGDGEDEDWEFTFDGKLAHLEEVTKIKTGEFVP